jgi:putative exosortase-associated protein (TIGR04073 family)
MQTTRSHRAILAAGVATVLLAAGAPPTAADQGIPAPITKLSRGIVNVVLGLPGEIVYRVVDTAHSDENLKTGGGYTGGFLSGLLMGVGWGAVRVGSGVVDVVTFPVPFDDNRPLLEPDYVL